MNFKLVVDDMFVDALRAGQWPTGVRVREWLSGHSRSSRRVSGRKCNEGRNQLGFRMEGRRTVMDY